MKMITPDMVAIAATHDAQSGVTTTPELPADNNTDQGVPAPALPEHLPHLAETLLSRYSDKPWAHPALLLSATSALGVCATGARAQFANGKWHSPTLLSYTVAPQASGKGDITELARFIIKAAGIEDRSLPARTSKPKLCEELEKIAPKHAMIISEESDAFASKEWAMSSVELRLAFDNDLMGQATMKVDTFEGQVNAYVNVVFCGTISALGHLIPQTENGTASRMMLSELPEQWNEPFCVLQDYTEEQMAEIHEALAKLVAWHEDAPEAAPAADSEQKESKQEQKESKRVPFLTKVVDLPRINEMLKEMYNENEREAGLEKDPAIKAFHKRAEIMAFRAAMPWAIIEGGETDAVVELARWVANYVLHQQLAYFGRQLRIETEKNNKKKGSGSPYKYLRTLDGLGETFSRQDFITAMERAECSVKGENVRNKLSTLKKMGLIAEVGVVEGVMTYRKL